MVDCTDMLKIELKLKLSLVVESIWKMKPDFESPETFSEPPTLAMVHDTIVCTPENKPENKPDDV